MKNAPTKVWIRAPAANFECKYFEKKLFENGDFEILTKRNLTWPTWPSTTLTLPWARGTLTLPWARWYPNPAGGTRRLSKYSFRNTRIRNCRLSPEKVFFKDLSQFSTVLKTFLIKCYANLEVDRTFGTTELKFFCRSAIIWGQIQNDVKVIKITTFG